MSLSINIMGMQVPCHLEKVKIDDLLFSVDNPRIFHEIDGGLCTQEEILSQLCSLGSTKTLVQDIYLNGGIVEEIIVEDDVVLEGNTRLAAYRVLRSRYPDDKRWRTIPAKILDHALTEDEKIYLLSSYHIKKKASWDAFEKAGFIYRAVSGNPDDTKKIAMQFGHYKSTIIAMSKAYETLLNGYKPLCANDESDWKEKYSYFEAFYRSKKLQEIIQYNTTLEMDFCKWVHDGVFKRAELVRHLPNILESKNAAEVFYEKVETDPISAYAAAEGVLAQCQSANSNSDMSNLLREVDNCLSDLCADSDLVKNIKSKDRLRLKQIRSKIDSMLGE